MKIVLVNTFDTNGGAAIACLRQAEALQSVGVQVKMLVMHKQGENEIAIETSSSQYRKKWNFYVERIPFIAFHEGDKYYRFLMSTASTGEDISKHPAIQEADIIHLHWINRGFLSFKSLQKLAELNKPILWTMHDQWPFTGGCHYSENCVNYEQQCGNCFVLKNPKQNDLTHNIWKKKNALYSTMKPILVGCSQWLAELARTSSLGQHCQIMDMPNPIPTDQFTTHDKQLSRQHFNLPQDKQLILFSAMSVNDRRKGFHYLAKAVKQLKKTNKWPTNVELVVFGSVEQEAIEQLDVPVHLLGRLNGTDAISKAYASSDIYIIPSLQDNLPNTVMEALACGVPVLAYNTGGIPEMVINGFNGQVVTYADTQALADGIIKLMTKSDLKTMSQNARQSVVDRYSYNIIGQKWITTYKKIISNL